MRDKIQGTGCRVQVVTGAGKKAPVKPVLFVLFFILVSCCSAAAAAYPQRADRYVDDFAGILAKTDRDTLRGMLEQLESKNGIEFAVVTVKSISDYGPGGGDVGDLQPAFLTRGECSATGTGIPSSCLFQ